MTADERFDSLFQWYAQQYGVDWTLLKAQVRQESGFNPGASNPSGAVGLAQFMPDTWTQYGGAASRLNPEASIKAQAHCMADLLSLFHGDVQKALAGYDWGQGNVSKAASLHGDSWLANSPAETISYVSRITAFQEEYRNA